MRSIAPNLPHFSSASAEKRWRFDILVKSKANPRLRRGVNLGMMMKDNVTAMKFTFDISHEVYVDVTTVMSQFQVSSNN